MFVKVARRGLMGPSEAVLPTMVVDGCRVFVGGCGGGVGLPGARGSGLRPRTKRFLVPGAGSASFEGGLAAVLRGVGSFDDLGPFV